MLVVTRLDRLARSTRDLLNVIAAIADRGAGFKSLKDAWADTTSAHGRLMLTVLGGLAEFERELIRARTGDGRVRAKARGVRFRPSCRSQHPPTAGSHPAPRQWRSTGRSSALLWCFAAHDFALTTHNSRWPLSLAAVGTGTTRVLLRNSAEPSGTGRNIVARPQS